MRSPPLSRDQRASLPANNARESFVGLAGDSTRDCHRDRVVVCGGEIGSEKKRGHDIYFCLPSSTAHE